MRDRSWLNDFMAFRIWVTPFILKVAFWLVAMVAGLAGFLTMLTDPGPGEGRMFYVLTGLGLVVGGPLVARVLFEVILVLFDVRDQLVASNAAIGGGENGESGPPAVSPTPLGGGEETA